MHPGECFQRRALKYKLAGEAVLGMTVVSFLCRPVYVPESEQVLTV